MSAIFGIKIVTKSSRFDDVVPTVDVRIVDFLALTARPANLHAIDLVTIAQTEMQGFG